MKEVKRVLEITNKESLEKYSSAVSLSDMEIFIFPELMFSLVLANIMSPVIWSWKEDPWFKGLDKMNKNKKLQRIKQFIMNNYDFNLDLDTWGLTTKEQELDRFKDFVDLATLKQSNALFGYEGDKYYFDMDIRKHFGLDKYNTETIPYWKTETIDAMGNFYRKEGYTKGAGECVSFATLYAAALFILGDIPLEDIYMIATPLHSQNFIDMDKGVLTNNRRIVTHNMWFNGTEISMKARRAIENEQITFVANNLGYVHRIYPEATMPEDVYAGLRTKMEKYLETKVDYTVMASYLRNATFKQVCFQFEHKRCGKTLYIAAEKVFPYEHGSPYLIGTGTQEKLLSEIDSMEFYREPIEGRVNLREIELLFKGSVYTVEELIKKPGLLEKMTKNTCAKITNILKELLVFCKTEPKLPPIERTFIKGNPVILQGMSERQEIIDYLDTLKENNEAVSLAFTAYRDIERSSWAPFMKAALERNPVIIDALGGLSLQDLYEALTSMDTESIYSENRLAQPDEVYNFQTGDGLEKAIAFMNVAVANKYQCTLEKAQEGIVTLKIDDQTFNFESDKSLEIKESDYAFLKKREV